MVGLSVHGHEGVVVMKSVLSSCGEEAGQNTNSSLPTHCTDVVGITNYIDIGFQMISDVGSADQSTMRLGASWQMNKNVLLKARAGLDGFSASAVFRSWWQPAFTLGLVAGYDLSSGQARGGATLAVESYRTLRCVGGLALFLQV